MTAADIIAAHQRRIDYNHPAYGLCHCGFDPEGFDADGKDNPGMGEHVLAALKAAGYEVVQLPTSDGVDDDGQEYFGDGEFRVDHTGSSEYPRLYINTFATDPKRARRDALALLAAANAAEEAK